MSKTESSTITVEIGTVIEVTDNTIFPPHVRKERVTSILKRQQSLNGVDLADISTIIDESDKTNQIVGIVIPATPEKVLIVSNILNKITRRKI